MAKRRNSTSPPESSRPTTWQKPKPRDLSKATYPHPMCSKACDPCGVECGVVVALWKYNDDKRQELLAEEPISTSPDWPAWNREYIKHDTRADDLRDEWRVLSANWIGGGQAAASWPEAISQGVH